MLGFPCLLFPVSSAAPQEIDFINDVNVALPARLQGLDNFTVFVLADSFMYAACAIIKLRLGGFVTWLGVSLCLNCVLLSTIVYLTVLEEYGECLWIGVSQWRGFDQESQMHPLLQEEWEGKPGALPGIHWPESALKYRDGKYNLCVLVADQIHRCLSIFWFGVAGVVSFALLSPVTAGLYSVYMGALFLFQQEGLRIYPKSPRLYHLLDIAFKGGVLFVAVFHPELLGFSCCLIQGLFVAYVACDGMYSLPKLLFGEGCSLKFGKKSGISRPFLNQVRDLVRGVGEFMAGFKDPPSLKDFAEKPRA